MKGINKVTLMGYVGNEPITKIFDNGEKAINFTLATSSKWKDKNGETKEKTEWHNIVAYRKLAEIFEKYVKKGNPIYIEGSLTTRTYEKEGQKHYSTQIIVNDFRFIANKESQGENKPPDDLPF